MSFNVIRHHRWWFVISSILVIISLISIFTKGFNFGIDYTGGTIVEVQFTKPVEKLNSDIGENTVKRIETVGAVIGSEVTQHALLNLVIAFAVLALYISYRFEYRIAASALTAIFHDLIMVLGVFSFFQLEIDASFLAAILTVVGYSMNESVVIFDRVRENAHTHKRTDTFEDLANASIAQSIHRSIYTLATVMFACVSLFVFGGDTTKNFALCMIIGFASGAYSSICVATSLWVLWKNRNKNDIRNQ